jgi:predicted Zn-dependent protease
VNSRYPADLRFSQSFENVIERWDRDWTKTWNDYTRRFDFTAGSDLKNIEQNLRPLFASAAVYPNLLVQLLDLRKSFEKQKDLESAATTARLASDLYPQSDRAAVFYAISLVLLGKNDEARTTVKELSQLTRKGLRVPLRSIRSRWRSQV